MAVKRLFYRGNTCEVAATRCAIEPSLGHVCDTVISTFKASSRRYVNNGAPLRPIGWPSEHLV